MKNEVQTTLRIEKEVQKKIRRFCLDNDMSFNEFAVNALIYCFEKKILPEKKD